MSYLVISGFMQRVDPAPLDQKLGAASAANSPQPTRRTPDEAVFAKKPLQMPRKRAGVKRALCAQDTVDAEQAEQQHNVEPHEHAAEDSGSEAAGGCVVEEEREEESVTVHGSPAKRRKALLAANARAAGSPEQAEQQAEQPMEHDADSSDDEPAAAAVTTEEQEEVIVPFEATRSPKAKRKMPKRKQKLSSRKGAIQGTAPPIAPRRVKYEALPLIDTANLLYDGEQADRRSAISWHYKAMGSPAAGVDEENWKGVDGVVSRICKSMGLTMQRCSHSVRDTLQAVCDDRDVRNQDIRQGRLGARKMTACDVGVAADCLTAGMPLRYAAAMVTGRRTRRMTRKKGRALNAAEKKIAKVTKECVRQTSKRHGADVHKRRSKKTGSADKSKGWAKASLAQAKQQKVQLAAGAGDRNALRDCRTNGWTVIALDQIAWWDERHRKVVLGCTSKYEWSFYVDKDHPECFILDPNDPRAVKPDPLPFTTAKYLSEARRSLGVAMKAERDFAGVATAEMIGHKFLPYAYDSQLMIGLEKYEKKVAAEIRRVETLVGRDCSSRTRSTRRTGSSGTTTCRSGGRPRRSTTYTRVASTTRATCARRARRTRATGTTRARW